MKFTLFLICQVNRNIHSQHFEISIYFKKKRLSQAAVVVPCKGAYIQHTHTPHSYPRIALNNTTLIHIHACVMMEYIPSWVDASLPWHICFEAERVIAVSVLWLKLRGVHCVSCHVVLQKEGEKQTGYAEGSRVDRERGLASSRFMLPVFPEVQLHPHSWVPKCILTSS